jgi:hypothetical protein
MPDESLPVDPKIEYSRPPFPKRQQPSPEPLCGPTMVKRATAVRGS